MFYFANKIPSTQGYWFSSSHVWMWELDHKETWALKNWCFHIVVLKTLERSNQSILKEISPEYSLEGLMLKLQYFGHLMQRTDSFEKTLMLGNIAGRRRRGRWGNSGNSVRLYFLGSKITADGDCSHEIKRRLLLGRKVMTNIDSILKSRDITLPTKVHLIKAMVIPVVWCMDVRVGLQRNLRAKELMLLNYSVGEDSWESLGLQGDPTSPF